MKNLYAIVLGLSVLLSVFIISNAYKNRNIKSDLIKVKGAASKNFQSDLIVWRGDFEKKDENLEKAYNFLKKDRQLIHEYLREKGVLEEEIVFSAVQIKREYDEKYDSNGNRISSTFTGYKLGQGVEVVSKNIDKIENISREITDLIKSGVEFESHAPKYYYTKLYELKHKMLEEASRDARERAEKIVANAGGKMGKLKNADMGIFQITGQNSDEEYTYGGTFNTSDRLKTATVTVGLNYELR